MYKKHSVQVRPHPSVTIHHCLFVIALAMLIGCAEEDFSDGVDASITSDAEIDLDSSAGSDSAADGSAVDALSSTDASAPDSNDTDGSPLDADSFPDANTSADASLSDSTVPDGSLPPTGRRASLLESPWKVGYGAAATGAGYNGRLYTVMNTNDSGPGSLREGLSRDNTWVVYDPSLDGETIYINSSLRPGANSTWDGRDALVRIAPARSANQMTLIRFYEGNAIMHRVLVGPDDDLSGAASNRYTAILISEGQDYWIDHVEVRHTDDDALGIGNGSTRAAINVTVTHYKVYSAAKGLLVAQDKAVGQAAGRVGRVTIAWSDFAARCRNFRVSGGHVVHGFNYYTHDFGGDTCGNVASHGDAANRDGTDTPVVLSESSVFNDSNTPLSGQRRGPAAIRGLPVQGYVFTDGMHIFEGRGRPDAFVLDPNEPNTSPVSRPVAPYNYTKMPTANVKAYVLRNAGVQGANIAF